jgi:hypothetical protein
MRFISLLIILLIALAVAGIGIVRTIGHGLDRDVFPLPAADRCWQGVCFVELPLSAVPGALDTIPRISPGSARFIDDAVEIGNAVTLEYQEYATARSMATMRLYIGAESYVMTRTDGSLMRAGDVVVQRGPPAALGQAGGPNVTLFYPAHGMATTVRPVEGGERGLWLRPDDPVRFVEVQAEGVLYSPQNPRLVSWHGFTIYTFPGDE